MWKTIIAFTGSTILFTVGPKWTVTSNMSDSCCQGSVDAHLLHTRQRRILAIVLVINAAKRFVITTFGGIG